MYCAKKQGRNAVEVFAAKPSAWAWKASAASRESAMKSCIDWWPPPATTCRSAAAAMGRL